MEHNGTLLRVYQATNFNINNMKKIIILLAFTFSLLTLNLKAQCHTYSDTAINYIVCNGQSTDSTYLCVSFYIVESPNKYGIRSVQPATIMYVYSASKPLSDNAKKIAIKTQVDAWISENYPAW